MTILVLADANADLSAAVTRFPAEGDDSQLSALSWGSGGCGVNVAAALARLGARSRLLARVGRDPAAQIALRVARESGVDLAAVQADDTLATGLCLAVVSPSGERTFFSYRGANAAWAHAPRDTATLAGAQWLHISGYALLEGRQRSSTLALLDDATQHDSPISLDLCLPQLRAWRDEALALLPRLHILFGNQPELLALLGRDAAAEPPLAELGALAADLCQHGVASVVVKLGPRGCLVASADGWQHAPAFAVDALDTNGCGDAFVAGFLVAHLQGAAPGECAALANAMGALTATRYGSAAALPERAALHAFLSQHPEQARLTHLLYS